MKFKDILKQIAEQELAAKPAGTTVNDPSASGSAPGDKAGARSLDDGQKLEKKEAGTTVNDPVASGSAPGSKSGSRDTDSADQLAAKEAGTKVNDPVAAISSAPGTEVQGNKIYEELEAELLEAIEALGEGWKSQEHKDKLMKDMKASVAKAGAKHKSYDSTWKKPKADDKEMNEAAADAKAAMVSAISASLEEGTKFKIDLAEDMKELVAKGGLTEEFAASAIEIFEAAVSSVATAHLATLNAYATTVMAEEFDSAVSKLEEAVEDYMAEAVVEWKEENKLAIDAGVKARISESFMNGLHELLEAHYIDLPAEKEDLYETAIAKGEEILEELNTEKAKYLTLEAEANDLRKKLYVESYVSGMVESHAEKIRSLSEDLSFNDEAVFRSKLETLKEAFVDKSAKAKPADLVIEDLEPVIEEETKIVSESEIEKLASRIGATAKRLY